MHLLKRYVTKDCKSILDVGCGKISPVKYLHCYIEKTGIDIFKPYLDEAKKNKTHDNYVCGDIREIEKYFSNKSFDCVISIGVVEHLEKNDAVSLIKKMENISKKMVFVGTTSGYVEQGQYENNVFQKHLCSFTSEELKNMGYTVLGTDGLKSFRVNKDGSVKKIGTITAIVATLSDPFLRYFPKYSFNLFAYKNINQTPPNCK